MKRIRLFSSRRSGFTLPELLVASALIGAVVASALAIHLAQQRAWRAAELQMEVDHEVNMAIGRIVYGSGARRGLRAANQASLVHSGTNWTLTYVTSGTQTNTLQYQAGQSNIVYTPGNLLVAENISEAQALFAPNLGTLAITVRVDRVRGAFRARRQAGTVVRVRN